MTALVCVVACSKEPSPAPEAAAPSAAAPAPVAAVSAAEPAASAQSPTPVLDPLAAAEEACGQILVVSYAGAAHAREGVTRDKEAARARAAELLAKVKAGADFAALAKAESDAPSSAPSGGLMGTFARSEWPAIHRPLEATVYGLAVDAVGEQVVEAPYGFVLVRRCAVEKAHSRHILVRYAGAKDAPADLKRTKADAFKLASDLQRKITGGSDFAEVARANSEDGSAERGGDVGTHGRGRMSAAYEDSLFRLKVGEVSVVVESEYGFHVIQRLPTEAEPVLDAPAVVPAPKAGDKTVARPAAAVKEAAKAAKAAKATAATKPEK